MTIRSAAPRRAALYVRVSTDEQAAHGFSLRDQEERLRQWCARERVEVAAVYVEQGASAKTFDRPEWRRLVAAVGERGQSPYDLVLVVKWDRFSRDMTGALSMIRTLGLRGVAVQAAEQPIDADVPEQLLMQALYVASPEVENRRRSISVRQGMRKAMLEGRWVSKPPLGYVRVRDARDRSVLAPCTEQGPLVAAAFQLAADASLPVDEVYRRARANGLSVKRSRFFEMLRQPVYVGRIDVAASGRDPAETVVGIHEPIVDETTWGRVQARLDRPRRRGERGPNASYPDRYPLKGLLLCPGCGLPQSPTHNTGRSAVYAYYTCHRCGKSEAKGGTGEAHRVRVEVAHAAVARHLAAAQLTSAAAAAWTQITRETAGEAAAVAQRHVADVRRELDAEHERLARAEDLYVDGGLSADALARVTARSAERVAALQVRLQEAEQAADVEGGAGGGPSEALAFALSLASDLSGLWERGDAEARRVLAGSVWPSGATFDREAVAFVGDSPLIDLFTTLRGETDGRRPPSRDRRPVRYAREDSNL